MALIGVEHVMTRTFIRFVLAGVAAIVLATPHTRARAQQRGGQPPPRQAVPPLGLDSTEDEIRQTVNAVRAGRKLTPKAWPNGARVAVGLSFDIDNELLSRGREFATLEQISDAVKAGGAR